MSYQVLVPKPVQKQLDSLARHVLRRVIRQIMALKDEARPHSCVKMRGYENEYRIRVGDYRIRYQVDDEKKVVILLRCRHRKDVYRR